MHDNRVSFVDLSQQLLSLCEELLVGWPSFKEFIVFFEDLQ
jgi:hypothetical protein